MNNKTEKEENDKIKDLVDWALIKLTIEAPLYGAMASAFPVVIDELPGNILAATNGSIIVVSKNSKKINKDNILALLAHEINHIILHHTRLNIQPSNIELWRMAQEIEAEMYIPHTFGTINDNLSELAQEARNKKHDSCDKIYVWLLKEDKKIKSSLFDILDFEGDEKENGEKKQIPVDLVISKVLMAQQVTKEFGDSSSNEILNKINELRKPRINWRSFLRQYWGTKVGLWDLETFSLSPTYWNTLHIPVPPLKETHGTPDVIIAIDTSGSMVGDPITIVLSEIRGLAGITSNVLVIICDSEIHGTFELQNVSDNEINELRKELRGGGGTSFVPVFNYIQKNKLCPQLLVYMTDTWGEFPEKVPSYPVLWITPCLEDCSVPFGDLVKIPPEEYT